MSEDKAKEGMKLKESIIPITYIAPIQLPANFNGGNV
jgi:hypothetical protein